MKPQKNYPVWITDDGARVFLGLPASDVPTRWAIVGEYIELDEGGHGFWIDVKAVIEGAGTDVKAPWTVTPSRCLLLWSFVITAQELDDVAQAKTAGFRKANS